MAVAWRLPMCRREVPREREVRSSSSWAEWRTGNWGGVLRGGSLEGWKVVVGALEVLVHVRVMPGGEYLQLFAAVGRLEVRG